MDYKKLQDDIHEAQRGGYNYAEFEYRNRARVVFEFEEVLSRINQEDADEVFRDVYAVSFMKEYYSQPTAELGDFPEQSEEVQEFAKFMKTLITQFDSESTNYIYGSQEKAINTLVELANNVDEFGMKIYNEVPEDQRGEEYLKTLGEATSFMFSVIKDNLDENFAFNLYNTVVKKNIAYGNSFDANVDKWGFVGATIRISDKVNRLNSLLRDKNDNMIEDESVVDTIMDILGYSILAIRYFTLHNN